MAQSKHPQSPPKAPPAIEKPPEGPPPGMLPPPPIETIYQPIGTECVRAPEEAPAELIVTFTVRDGLQLKRHTYLVQQPGKEAITDGVAGGIVLPEK